MKTALVTCLLVDSASFMKCLKNAELLSESVKRLCWKMQGILEGNIEDVCLNFLVRHLAVEGSVATEL